MKKKSNDFACVFLYCFEKNSHKHIFLPELRAKSVQLLLSDATKNCLNNHSSIIFPKIFFSKFYGKILGRCYILVTFPSHLK